MKHFIKLFVPLSALFLLAACAVHYAAEKSTFDGTVGTHSTIVTVPDSSNISNNND